jgi:hypothetical protein
VAAPLMGVWVAVGLILGRAQEKLAQEDADTDATLAGTGETAPSGG